MSFFKKMFGGKSESQAKVPASQPGKDYVASTTVEPPVVPTPILGGAPSPTDPHQEPDPAFGHPLAFKARRYAQFGDLEGLEHFYQAHQGDDAHLIVKAITDNNDFSERLEEWGYAAKDSATAQLFCGQNFHWRAWEARGGRLAKDVSGGQWKLFGTWLDEAEAYLHRAKDLNPRDAEPWAALIGVHLGKSGASQAAAEAMLDQVHARHPSHLPAHLATLTHTLEKWGGSHDAMYEFARRITQREPDGSPLHTVVPGAILERSVYYIIEKDADGANAYLQSSETRNFLYEAYLKSSGSDQLTQTCLTPIVHNWFACAAIYSQLKVGRVALQKMGAAITDRPWAYFGMPVIGQVNELRDDFGYDPV